MLQRYGQFLFKFRNQLFPLVLAGLLLGFRPHLAGGSPETDSLLDLVGFGVILAGLTLRALVIGTEYISRGGKNKQVYANELVTGGLFAHCRNPLYVANLLLFAGILIIFNNPWAYLSGLTLAITAYMAIVAAEEAFLIAKFGDQFEHYARRVPRWLIDPRGLRANLAGYRFNWARIVVKDYGTAYLWPVLGMAVVLYEHAALGAPLAPATRIAMGTVFVTLTIAYLTVLVLKKRKILTKHGWRTARSA